MKSLQITFIIPCIVIVFLSSGVALAFNSNDLTATVNFSTETVKVGDTFLVRIAVTSNTQQVQIQVIGINFDWNDQDFFYAPIVSSDPQTLAVNESYLSAPIMIQVPYNVTTAIHNYHVGIEGKDASGNDFSWDGPIGTIQATGAGGGVTTPTPPTPQSGGGEGETRSPQNWTLYIAIMAVAAIVIAVLFIVMEMRKKPEKLAPAAENTMPLAESPKPEANKPNPAADQPLIDIEE